jgi:hypothetical protein
MKKLKHAKHHLQKQLKHPLVGRLAIGASVLVLLAILARPQVTAATAVKVKFMDCTAIADRALRATPHQAFTFRVTTDADGTFLMEDLGIKQPLKAGKPHFFTITPTQSKGYGFKLEKCNNAGGAVLGLRDDGSDPSMRNIRYMHEGHSSHSDDEGTMGDKPDMEGMDHPDGHH